MIIYGHKLEPIDLSIFSVGAILGLAWGTFLNWIF